MRLYILASNTSSRTCADYFANKVARGPDGIKKARDKILSKSSTDR